VVVRHVACPKEIRNAYRVLMGKHEGKTPRGRPRTRRKGINWIDLGQDKDKVKAAVNTVMNIMLTGLLTGYGAAAGRLWITLPSPDVTSRNLNLF
jgi:hypothetical protein